MEDVAGEHPVAVGKLATVAETAVLAMVWEGENAVQVCRNMMGKTNPQESAPGTIRGDFGMVTGVNIIHGSDSVESAKREIGIFFPEGVVSYERTLDKWTYE